MDHSQISFPLSPQQTIDYGSNKSDENPASNKNTHTAQELEGLLTTKDPAQSTSSPMTTTTSLLSDGTASADTGRETGSVYLGKDEIALIKKIVKAYDRLKSSGSQRTDDFYWKAGDWAATMESRCREIGKGLGTHYNEGICDTMTLAIVWKRGDRDSAPSDNVVRAALQRIEVSSGSSVP